MGRASAARSVISQPRTSSAAEALLAARRDLLQHRIGPSDLAAPQLYAGRLLESDDDYGRRGALIVQGDGVTWPMVDALVDVALLGSVLHQHIAHHGQRRVGNCEWCDRAERFWHVALVDPITARRGVAASDLDARARAAVAGWLSG